VWMCAARPRVRRETDLLDPVNLVQKVHAIVLAGGSAYGLDAASGVMRYLEEQKIGFNTGAAKVPIVPAAILYDLNVVARTFGGFRYGLPRRGFSVVRRAG